MNRTVSEHRSCSWGWVRALSLNTQCIPARVNVSLLASC